MKLHHLFLVLLCFVSACSVVETGAEGYIEQFKTKRKGFEQMRDSLNSTVNYSRAVKMYILRDTFFVERTDSLFHNRYDSLKSRVYRISLRGDSLMLAFNANTNRLASLETRLDLSLQDFKSGTVSADSVQSNISQCKAFLKELTIFEQQATKSKQQIQRESKALLSLYKYYQTEQYIKFSVPLPADF